MKQKIEEGDKREKVGVPTTGLTEQGMFSLFSCFPDCLSFPKSYC